MKYFSINFSKDPSITGILDGSPQAEIPKKHRKGEFSKVIDFFCSNDPVEFWQRIGTLPDFDFSIDFVKLKSKAKLTDFLDLSPIISRTFLVSPRGVDLLRSAKVSSPHKFYQANLYGSDGREIPGYNFLCCPALKYDCIDFHRSRFYKGEGKKKQVFTLSSAEEFETLKNDDLFEIETLVFNENFNKELDFFCPRPTISQFYISEKLRQAFERESISGLDIDQPIDPVLII